MPIEKPIGLVNKKTGKLWAGENYGEQSQESYDKLFAAGKLNPVQQRRQSCSQISSLFL